MEVPIEISPQEVARRRAAGEALTLIDVREGHEFSTARIEGSELIPMNSVPEAIGRLEAQADKSLLVTICHHGVRSLNVAAWLRNQGVSNCASMAVGSTAGASKWIPLCRDIEGVPLSSVPAFPNRRCAPRVSSSCRPSMTLTMMSGEKSAESRQVP